jgi:cell wall-associated NlpC family hydrolase
VAAAAALLVLAGCGASSPRFRGAEAVERGADEEHEIRFAAKIREEEKKEDDRKVDASREARRSPAALPERENAVPGGIERDRFLLEAVSYLGVPYVYGGTSREGMDCSGFTSRVYRDGARIEIPRSTAGQYQTGFAVEADSLLFGDLIFFNTTGRSPSHVGIYLEDGLFAHASVSYGVTISSLESTYYKNRFVGARRVAGSALQANDRQE